MKLKKKKLSIYNVFFSLVYTLTDIDCYFYISLYPVIHSSKWKIMWEFFRYIVSCFYILKHLYNCCCGQVI